MKSTSSQARSRKNSKDSRNSSEADQASTTANRGFIPTEGRFRLAFENAPIGMAIVDFDYRLRRVNKTLCEALGYPADELLDRRFGEITHPDDIEGDMALADRLFRGEIPSYRLEKRFVAKDGTLAWLDLTALLIRNEDGDPLYGLAMVENITDRKRSQEALRTSEERYRSFVVNSSEGIYRVEVEQPLDISLPIDEQIGLLHKYGYLAECNDTLARMHGYSRAEDIVGMAFSKFALGSSPANTSSMRQLVSSGYRLLDLQTEDVDSKGLKRYFSSSLIGIVINGMLLRIWGVQTDQTEQRTAKLDLERSNRQMRSLSAHLQSLRERERTELAREIHDTLGQSLASMKIDVSLLRKKLKPDIKTDLPRLQEKLEEISELLDETISTVKTLATELRPGVLDKFGLVAAMEWQAGEFSRRFGIRSECTLPHEELALAAEPSTSLFRIFQEALTNVARHAQADDVKVDLAVDESNISLTVSDNGRGITEEEIDAPSSLGLLGIRERAQGLGGTLTIARNPGGGTVVSVRTPLTGSCVRRPRRER